MDKPLLPICGDQAQYLMLSALIRMLDMRGDDSLVEVAHSLLLEDQLHPGDRDALLRAAQHLADEFTVRATALFHEAQQRSDAQVRLN